MRRSLDYLRLLLFTAGVLVGVQLPAFVDQYERSVVAHLREAELALAHFERDARLHTAGDLGELIARYRRNADAAVRAGGDSIAELEARVVQLQGLRAALARGPLWRAWHTWVEAEADIRAEVWESYGFIVPLNAEAIVWGLGLGLIAALLVETALTLLLLPLRLLRRPRRRPLHAR